MRNLSLVYPGRVEEIDLSLSRTEVDLTSTRSLVDQLQTELNDAWLKGAGDLAACVGHPAHDTAEGDRSPGSGGCCCRALRSADGAGKVKVGVVEEVVELGAELKFQALDRGAVG